MSNHDERRLRASLAAALDDLEPRPFPLHDVVRRGRAVKIRRRLTAAAAAAVVIAAAIAVPTLAHQLNRPRIPVSLGHYHVVVNPPAPGSPPGLIADGTINGQRWQVTGLRQRFGGTLHQCFRAAESSCVQARPPVFNRSGRQLDRRAVTVFEWPDKPGGYLFFTRIASRPQLDVGYVRDDIVSLRVSLSNGQQLRLTPVPVFGRKYGGYVAFPVPAAAAVIRVSAYTVRGPFAYAVPFTALGSVVIVRWLAPGQQARPRTTYTIGSGRANGQAWAEHVYVGPWGSCVGGAGRAIRCWDHIFQMARHRGAGQILDSIGNGGTDVIVVSAAPSVSYLVVRRADGSTARASVVPAAGARFCVFASVTGNRAIRWTAYSAAGTRLASGPVPAP